MTASACSTKIAGVTDQGFIISASPPEFDPRWLIKPLREAVDAAEREAKSSNRRIKRQYAMGRGFLVHVLRCRGLTYGRIAGMTGRSAQTVSTWFNQFRRAATAKERREQYEQERQADNTAAEARAVGTSMDVVVGRMSWFMPKLWPEFSEIGGLWWVGYRDAWLRIHQADNGKWELGI